MSTTTSTHGLTVTGVPKMPFWFTILRGAAIVLSLGVLITAAYHLSLLGSWAQYYGGSGPAGFLIFDAIFTWLVLGSMLASEYFAPHLYMRLLFFGSLVLTAIFWLSAWAWAASWAADFYRVYDDYGLGRANGLDAWGATLAAGAALGAVTWVLVVVFTVFFVRACLADPHGSSFSPRPQNDAEAAQPKPEGPVYA
ncbi:uncharacterized protein BKA55DRAFT_561458 [Fusarium redolens]|uniref:MARVEL domain-containing protein n=1 Tax=Fusarium redolens TaxID=48865 RepID=A0A9P9HPK9_FUSRE|nr:uncharacterized protein BKA55DRAFT_561458 [Fusarium redolens]KAH7261484.1 hypothetical protein BKA55DRAFT_561458 [Fusarium redolens]